MSSALSADVSQTGPASSGKRSSSSCQDLLPGDTSFFLNSSHAMTPYSRALKKRSTATHADKSGVMERCAGALTPRASATRSIRPLDDPGDGLSSALIQQFVPQTLRCLRGRCRHPAQASLESQVLTCSHIQLTAGGVAAHTQPRCIFTRRLGSK